jgi:hypothetical protein
MSIRRTAMTESNTRKDYCDAEDQKKVVDKMMACDENSKDGKEKDECYAKVVKEDGGCMSS